jgi:hypothetical protein
MFHGCFATETGTVVDKTHSLKITRGREGLGLNDQGFIVTAESNNIT